MFHKIAAGVTQGTHCSDPFAILSMFCDTFNVPRHPAVVKTSMASTVETPTPMMYVLYWLEIYYAVAIYNAQLISRLSKGNILIR